MNAEQFRIGNYYQPTFKLTPDGPCPYAVVDVPDLSAWSKGAVYGKPLPITEEWLLKAGFYDNSYGSFILNLSEDLWITVGFKDYSHKLFFGTEVSDISVPVEYVHQLQNLYFALTGKELTLSL